MTFKKSTIVPLLKDFPLTEVAKVIKQDTDLKADVDALLEYAIEEAVKIDEDSMSKHNSDATVLSMNLVFTTLALFVDGLLRMLGIIPPFMDLDVNILERIVDRVETDVIDKVRQVPIQKLFQR